MEHRIGVVVIGRNEGERFRRCLASLEEVRAPVVYVDSGSTDGSVEWARSRCAAVVALDPSVPFTAARARNAGFERLIQLHGDVQHVQFVDGDCEVVAGWLERGSRELEADARRAVVCGRRRELRPAASIYNRMCDIEWDTPVGPARASGGDAMVRATAFREVGGFDASLLAGEEPELCVRLRARGWSVLRVGAEMTLHDAAMTRLAQWWRRCLRAGYGYGQGFARHGRTPERLYARKIPSILFSGLLVPLAALGLLVAPGGWSLALLAWYPVRIARFAIATRRRGVRPREAWSYAAFCMLANVPQLLGLTRYVMGRAARRPAALIEYKEPSEPARGG